MYNKILEEEIKKKKKGHKIFEKQDKRDIKELRNILKSICKNDLVIYLNTEEWFDAMSIIFYSPNPDDCLKKCSQYMALKMLEQLSTKCKDLNELDFKKYFSVFKKSKQDDYEKVKDELFEVSDVIELIKMEDIKVDTIHFILDDIRSQAVCDCLTPCLDKDLPFSTTIYCAPYPFYTTLLPNREERRFIWEEYSYTIFNGYNEGQKIKAKGKTKIKK